MFSQGFIENLKHSFGEMTDSFRLPGTAFLMLKRNEHSVGWKTVRQLTNHYSVSYVKDTNRKMIVLTCFSTDITFLDDFAQTTHFAWGVPDNDNEITLYEIDPEQKDETEPDGLSPAWRAVATKVGNERYEIQ